MRGLKFRIALLVSVAALAGPIPAHEPLAPATKHVTLPLAAREAAAAVDSFHAALRRGDTAAAAALLADDALIFESGGVERTKAEYAGYHLAADAAFSQSISTTVTSRAGGSNGIFAWVASEGRTTGTYKGKALDLVTTETMILRRVGKEWRIIHIHWSSRARP